MPVTAPSPPRVPRWRAASIPERLPSLGFIGLGVGFLFFRVGSFSNIADRVTDTPGYERVAQLPLWSIRFYTGERGFTVPLVYKILSTAESRIIGQLVLSIVCWLVLAAVAARAARSTPMQLIVFGAVLTFALATQIVLWDTLLISESISFSLMALMLAAWLSLVWKPSSRRAAVVLSVSLFWAFARDTNADVVLFAGLLAAVSILRDGQRRLKAVLAIGCIVIFALSTLSADAGARWRQPMVDVIAHRVLPSPALARYFEHAGLAPHTDWTQSDWIDQSARSTYARYLLTHPSYALLQPFSGHQQALWSSSDNTVSLLDPSTAPYNDNVSHRPIPLPDRAQGLVFPHGLTALFALVALSLIASLAAAARGRLQQESWVLLGVLLTIYPQLVLVWHMSGVEVDRHALTGAVLLRLSALILLLLAVDRLVAPVEEPERLAASNLRSSRAARAFAFGARKIPIAVRPAERAQSRQLIRGRLRADAPWAVGMIALLAVVAFWNATKHQPVTGYDAGDNIAYADGLVRHGVFPHGTGSYYTPPGYYALAGAADWVGQHVGMGIPTQAGQYLNALLTIATALLVLQLARTLWPGRRVLHATAVGFFVLLPVVVKVAAMYHPEPLSLFLSTLSLLLAVRMLRRGDYRLRSAAALGVALGLAQLARAWSLTTVAVVLIALAAAALVDRERRRSVLAALGVVVVCAALVPSPWYVHQARVYSNPVFNRPQQAQPLWDRRPAGFYLDPALPASVTRPYSGSFNDRFLPILYSETWGDYFGAWRWGFALGTLGSAKPWLIVQNLAGALPTLLACAGVVALLLLAFRRRRLRPELVPLALLPIAGVAAVLYFGVAYPTPDGDTVKGTYALTTAPAFALAFALVVEHLARRRALLVPLCVLLGASAIACLHFDIL